MPYSTLIRRLSALEVQAEQNAPPEPPDLPVALVEYYAACGHPLPTFDITKSLQESPPRSMYILSALNSSVLNRAGHVPIFLEPLQREMLCQAYTALRWGLARRRRGEQQISLSVLPHEDERALEMLGLDDETFRACWDDVWGTTWVAHWRANVPTDADPLDCWA